MSQLDMNKASHGFTLMTALFLLVVLALLSVYMITIRNVQQSTIVFGLQGARAQQAAQTGLEWGIYESMRNGNCAASSNFTPSGSALAAFRVVVDCSVTDHREGADLIRTFQLTSTSQTDAYAYGSLDYVFRSLRATVSVQPP